MKPVPRKTELSDLRPHFDDNPGLFDAFAGFVESCDNVNLGDFLEEVDASDYSLQDWAEAWLGFDDWLRVKQITHKDFGNMLGYFHCCLLMLAPQPGRPDLQLFVNQCLTEFGFHPEIASQT